MQPTRLHRRRLIVFAPFLACLVLTLLPVQGASAVSVHLEPVLTGLRQPLDVRAAPDGSDRLFVAEKNGIIRVAHGSQLSEQPFLDIRGVVGARGSEQGLLGFVFHPRYAENGFLYVNYTDVNGDSVVARYQVSGDPNVVDPGTGSVVLTVDQPFPNHNAGNLVFGPDGYLWIAWGDGGSGGDPRGNGQNGGTWLGKMLRIDVDNGSPYTVPPDNPFVGNPDILPEIWGLGLRNPWRYSFDALTGDLWLGDVGQNSWEELDHVPAGTAGGVNFGWNVTEANHCFRSDTCDLAQFWPAVAEYRTGSADGCAIVGGFVYRGAAFPQLDGVYFYSDECSGRVWSAQQDGAGNWFSSQLLDTDVAISSFGEDQSHELYVTGLNNGTVYRIVGD